MSDLSSDTPEFIFYNLPEIGAFHVTRDVLKRARKESISVADDLNVSLATGLVCITLLSSLALGTYGPIAEGIIVIVALGSGITSVTCGIRW